MYAKLTNSNSRSPFQMQMLLLCILAVVLLLRLFTLECGDLLDPTETRYATIAEHMVHSGDWVTPRLPVSGELEAYLSKPPLHFWMTAVSYSLFGIDEWSSRLPSFLGLLLIGISLFVFSREFLSKELGYLSIIICSTCPLMFFLGGSSTVDVTFAGFIIAAQVSYACALLGNERSSLAGILFFVFTAASFLTKGPAGLILVGFPPVFLCGYQRTERYLTDLPWGRGLCVFLLCTIPWFYYLEQSNPGATSYYFITENVLRFVSKDYGGHHGSAHIRPFGSIWWMMGLSVLPWLLFVLRHNTLDLKTLAKELQNPIFMFILSSTLGPLIFFTFARSILPAYTTPAIPGFSLLVAYLLVVKDVQQEDQAVVAISSPVVGYRKAGIFGAALTVIMVIGLILAAPYIEPKRSAGKLLESISKRTKAAHPTVATVSTRDLSPYWVAGAYKNELAKPVDVTHATLDDIANKRFRHLLVRDKRLSEHGSQLLLDNYKERKSRGRWHWYTRRSGDS